MLAFIIAIAAGFATPYLQGPVGQNIAKPLSEHMTLESGEHRLIAFIVAMLLGAIVIALTGGGSPFWVILGGGIGVFLARGIDAGRARYSKRD